MPIDAETWQKIQAWMTFPKRSDNLLLVVGTAGSGKSEFVRETARNIDGSIVIECAGMTADLVARRIVSELGGDLLPSGRRWRRDLLRTTVEGEHVVLLSNVQWAGELVTSSEPLRIARSLVSKLTWAPKARVRFVLEWDPDLLGDPPRGSVGISLQRPGAPADGRESLQGADTATRQAFHALSLSELTEVDLSVWRLLVMAAFPSRQPPTEAGLRGIATDHPEALTVLEGATGHPGVGFRRPSTRHFWRRQGSAGPEQQARIAESLIEHIRESNPGRPWTEAGAVGRYAAKSLPVHAALAGSLEQALSQGWILANCEALSVLEALGAAYPEGVPPGSIAADIRSLEAQGIQPADQGEWASWLHHAAVSSGRTELARQIVDSGVALPWRTVWSRWRPSGVFGGYEGEVGRVDEIALAADAARGQRVITMRDTTTDKAALPEFSYVMREWDVPTGSPVGEEVRVEESLEEAEWLFADRAPQGLPAVFAVHSPSGWQVEEDGAPPPPRVPASVTSGVHVEGMWVLAGSGGLFAVSADTALAPGPATWLPEPLVEEHAGLALPEVPLPARAAARGEPSSRLWLEASFGEGTCHRLAAPDLPDGVEDQAARRFLTDIGLPVVGGFLNLYVDSPLNNGLRQVPWSDKAQNRPPDGAGPFFLIGRWMYSQLLLDGTSGQVLRDATRGPSTVLAGSSLSQFFTVVRLFDEHRKTLYPSRADRRDHHRILREWCRRIDPVALEGEVWDVVLGPYDFEDSTWDLVSPDGRFP